MFNKRKQATKVTEIERAVAQNGSMDELDDDVLEVVSGGSGEGLYKFGICSKCGERGRLVGSKCVYCSGHASKIDVSGINPENYRKRSRRPM